MEWPPSPWRLLRGLLATGFTKCGWDRREPPAEAQGLVERLASVTPSFVLPPASLGHSRHYVDAAGKRPLILDAWARIEDDGPPLEICWPVELEPAQLAVLAELAPLLGYLGRAESWVEARVVERLAGVPNCAPADGPPAPGYQPVRALCPISPSEYATWRFDATRRLETEYAVAPGKKPTAKQTKDRERAFAPYPTDLISALCAETGWLQGHGWSSAPGSREVVYWRRTDALEVGPTQVVRHGARPSVPFVLLALSTASRNRSGLPIPERVFAQGRLLHKALSAAVTRRGVEGAAMALLGRDGDQPSRSGHQHAHLLHLGLDDEKRLDHVLVWAPGGMDTDALQAVRAVRKTWMKGGVGELQVAVVAAGDARALRDLDEAFEHRLSARLGPSEGATRWASVTPYVAPRWTKPGGRDSLVGQIRLELDRRGFPPAEVELLPREDDRRLAFRRFVLHDGKHHPPMPVTHAVRLTFERPVHGPICLGYGSHFGLGSFAVDAEV